MEFLDKHFLGLPILNYVHFAVIVLLAFLLKTIISRVLTKASFAFFHKFSGDSYFETFKTTIKRPLENVIVTVLLYIAINQIAPLLERVSLLRKTSEELAQQTNNIVKVESFTLLQLADRIFFFVLIITLTNLIVKTIRFIFLVFIDRAVARQDKERQQLLPLLRDVFTVVLWSITFFIILGVVFKVNVVTLVAGLGMGGIAVAFALKDSLENLLSSFMILIDKPFVIGDWIKINNAEGNVEKIGFRSTHIRTFDNTLITIPNRSLISDSLENYSERGKRRVKLTVGAQYGLSQEQLKTIINNITERIEAHPDTLDTPNIFLDSFGDFSVNIMIVYFVKIPASMPFEKVKEAMNYEIYQVMYQYGTGFAIPTQVELSGEVINNVAPQKED